MKRIVTIVFLSIIISACNNTSEKKTESNGNENTAAPEVTTSEEPEVTSEEKAPAGPVKLNEEDIAKGKQLVAQSDCLACHMEEGKLVGPSYVDVAKEYEPTKENIKYLSDKIINGGSGVWGDIPMAAHPSISVEDSKKMVQYILSLAK